MRETEATMTTTARIAARVERVPQIERSSVMP